MLTVANDFALQVHGSAGHEHGVSASLNDFLGSLSSQSSDSIMQQLLPGIGAMVNLHPLVVHFPIALLMMFFGIELLSLFIKRVELQVLASGLLYLGALSAGLAVLFGLQAAETVAHDESVHAMMERHEQIGLFVLGLSGFLSAWRLVFKIPKLVGFRILFLMVALVLQVLLITGADLGGVMVYRFGVAVQTTAGAIDATPTPEHEHTHGHGTHSH